MPKISQEHLDEIMATGLMTGEEACGILVNTPSKVILRSLSNISSSPSDSYEIDNQELVETLVDIIELTGHQVSKSDVTIWHTHPSGHVGPSRADLRYKEPELNYLVVAIPSGEATVF